MSTNSKFLIPTERFLPDTLCEYINKDLEVLQNVSPVLRTEPIPIRREEDDNLPETEPVTPDNLPETEPVTPDTPLEVKEEVENNPRD